MLDRKNIIIFLTLLLALILRFFVINQSLWLDEAIGAIEIRDNSFKHVMGEFPKFDNHPPLYYMTLKIWSDIFGYSEISLRFPSVLFGLATIFLTYLISKKLIPKKTKSASLFPLISSLLIATSQIHIYYSQEARMYSMAAFFAALTIYLFMIILAEKPGLKHWLVFSLAVTCLIFTDYMPVFILPVFFILGFIRKKKKGWWFKFVACFIPLLVFGLAWLPVFQIQSEGGRWLLKTMPGWKSVAGGANLKQAILLWIKFVFGRLSLANRLIYYFLVILVSVPSILAIYWAFLKRNRHLTLLFCWLILPPIFGFLISAFLPAFIYFRFLFILPAFYLIIGWGVSQLKQPIRNLVCTVLIASNLLSYFFYIFDAREQREQWRQATFFIEQIAKKDEIVVFEYPEPFTPYRWYSKGSLESFGALDEIYADPSKTFEKTQQIIEGKSGIYYFEYLKDLSDPKGIVEDTIKKENYKLEAVYDFIGVGQIFYYVK